VGYNKDNLMLIWIVYNNNSEFTNSYGYIGKNIWADTMEEIEKECNDNWYKKSDNVVGVILDAVTGDITNDSKKAAMYYYIKGSEPNIEDDSILVNKEN
jgi:membrane carboxypeptidase/penicillin-binding protein